MCLQRMFRWSVRLTVHWKRLTRPKVIHLAGARAAEWRWCEASLPALLPYGNGRCCKTFLEVRLLPFLHLHHRLLWAEASALWRVVQLEALHLMQPMIWMMNLHRRKEAGMPWLAFTAIDWSICWVRGELILQLFFVIGSSLEINIVFKTIVMTVSMNTIVNQER